MHGKAYLGSEEKNKLKAHERLQKVMEGQIDGVHEQMFQKQALKIENGDDPVEVKKWSLGIEMQLEQFQEAAVSGNCRRCERDGEKQARGGIT